MHVLPEKIAEKRHHPQTDAIQTLCLLSLVFGGLLWPIAWLWAYTKPVGYQIAYGTEKHDDYYDEMGEQAKAGDAAAAGARATCARELDAMAAQGRAAAEAAARCARTSRSDCERRLRSRRRPPRGTAPPRKGGAPNGSILLLGIYSFFVWLIFIKFKWLPWNIYSQVTVVIIPIVALAVMILTLNVVAPSSTDLRVYQVHRADRLAGARTRDRGAGRGGQPAREEGRRAVPHRPDAVPARGQHATAQLASASAQQKELEESLKGAQAGVTGGARRDRAGGGEDR